MRFLFLPSILIIVLVISHNIKRSQRKELADKASFWEMESRANDTRKTDISNLPYIEIPYDKLPFYQSENPDIKYIESNILNLKDAKVLNLTGITNTDLKLNYGPANLDVLSSYDENYTTLVRNINQWGQKLYKDNEIDKATTVLEYGIKIGTDVTSTYTLLANIYISIGQTAKIDTLISTASNLNTMSKNIIVNNLNNIKESI